MAQSARHASGMVSCFVAAYLTTAPFCRGLVPSMITAVIDFRVSRIANISNGSGLETAHVSIRPVATSTPGLAIACRT
ncbi:hypothethical protein (plasmid) [Ralstonia solanacearum CMR15]|nr:hypothethical protein [Ralstonia solanacearum CMR15]